MSAPSSPSEINENFGVHYPDWFVRWSVDAMRAWHIPPATWLNVPEAFILDLIRWVNQADAVNDAKERGEYFGAVSDEAYDLVFEGEDDMRIDF